MYSADRTQFITLPARHEGTALRAVPATAPAYFSTPPPPPPLVPYTGPVVPPTLAAFMPSRNVTTTLVTGPHLDGGFAYACRPLPRYPAASGGSSGGLPATYVPALRAVRCALAQPSANVTLPLALTLHVSLDGEQYNAGGAPFTFYPAPIISRVLPAGGPVRGGAAVSVIGQHLGHSNHSAMECRIGASRSRAVPLSEYARGFVNASDEPHSAMSCPAPEARFAGLLFGSVDGWPLPNLTGVWRDSYGHDVHVCTRDGGFAATVEPPWSASLGQRVAAVGLWDEQHLAYIGMWQQWRESLDEPLTFGVADALATALPVADRVRLHAGGFFKWGVNRTAVGVALAALEAEAAAAAASAAATVGAFSMGSSANSTGNATGSNATGSNATGSNATGSHGPGTNATGTPPPPPSSPTSVVTSVAMQRLLARLFPRQVEGAWSMDGAARHFGTGAAGSGHVHGAWNATYQAPLPADAVECTWLERRSAATSPATAGESSGAGAQSSASSPAAAAFTAAGAAAAAAAAATMAPIDLAPLSSIADALDAMLPFALLGTARMTHGVLESGARPRQYFELTRPLPGEMGAVNWPTPQLLAAHRGCAEQLSFRASVYYGGGVGPEGGGDGLSLVLGHVTTGALLHTLSRPNGTLGPESPLMLRLRRLRVGQTPETQLNAIELWAGGVMRWRTDAPGLAGRWIEVNLVLLNGGAALNLAINGRPLLLQFGLSPWALRAPWSFGAAASTFAFTDTHAVANVRGSCGDVPLVDLPFTVTNEGFSPMQPDTRSSGRWTDGQWVDPFDPAEYGPPPTLEHRPFRYYSERSLVASSPALGHVSGGALIRINGTGLDVGVGFSCAFGIRSDEVPDMAPGWTWAADGPLHPRYSTATWLAAEQVVACRAPQVPYASSVQLRVSLNAQQFSVAALNYTFFAPVITEFAPSSGPVAGGTTLVVRGTQLDVEVGWWSTPPPLARCVFNQTMQVHGNR
jgi:hypothetical protein